MGSPAPAGARPIIRRFLDFVWIPGRWCRVAPPARPAFSFPSVFRRDVAPPTTAPQPLSICPPPNIWVVWCISAWNDCGLKSPWLQWSSAAFRAVVDLHPQTGVESVKNARPKLSPSLQKKILVSTTTELVELTAIPRFQLFTKSCSRRPRPKPISILTQISTLGGTRGPQGDPPRGLVA